MGKGFSAYYSSREKNDSCLVCGGNYLETAEWIDMLSNPEEHYWWGDLDAATYNKLETALHEEITRAQFSSRCRRRIT